MAEIETRIKALKAKRTELKRKITNLNSYLNKHKENPDITNVELRYDGLKNAFNAFEESHQELIEVDPEGGHSDEYDIVSDNYFELASRIKKIITPIDLTSTLGASVGTSERMDAIPVPNEPTNQRPNNDDITFRSSGPRRTIKLPEITIPRFSGKQVDWLTWKDQFEAMIHEDPGLTLSAKMHYLQSALADEAADKIKILTLRGTDYVEAWEHLNECYDNKRLIISTHLEALLNLPAVDKQQKTSEGLTKLADHTRLHLKALAKYNIQVTPEIVVKIIEAKLPQFLQNKWDETIENDDYPKLDDMIIFLRRWAARTSVKSSKAKNVDSPRPKRGANHDKEGGSDSKRGRTDTRPQTFATTTHTKQTSQKKCFHCNDSHAIMTCDKFLALSEHNRYGRAKELKICINCLKGPHKASDCRQPPCRECSKKHHTLLHFSQPKSKESED